MKKYFILVIAMFLSACATKIQTYKHELSPHDGTIVIYRDNAFLKGMVPAVIYIDNVPVTKISINRYVLIPLSPGAHIIGVNGDTYSGENFQFEIFVESKQIYYYEVSPKSSQWLLSLAPPISQIGTSPFTMSISDENKFADEKKDMRKIKL